MALEWACPSAAMDVSGGEGAEWVLPFGEVSENCSESTAGTAHALRLATSRFPMYSTKKESSTPAMAIAVVVPS